MFEDMFGKTQKEEFEYTVKLVPKTQEWNGRKCGRSSGRKSGVGTELDAGRSEVINNALSEFNPNFKKTRSSDDRRKSERANKR